jgi:uncharacterized protein
LDAFSASNTSFYPTSLSPTSLKPSKRMNDDITAIQQFDGIAKLFPLPNLVLYPAVEQGLHIFEPRYRQMTSEALDSDNLITIVLLQSDQDEQNDTVPTIASVGCLAKIIYHERLVDGRYNLLVRGLVRVKLLEDISNHKLYRTAKVEILSEQADITLQDYMAIRRKLANTLLPLFDSKSEAYRHLSELISSEMPLTRLCDTISYAFSLPLDVKQRILEEQHIRRRSEILLDTIIALTEKVQQSNSFPPSFSAN